MNIIWRGPIPAWNPQTGQGNYQAGRNGEAIKGIVIHTMVTNLAGADATFHNPARVASAHYGISYDGATVYQWVKDGDTAYQCGRLDIDPLDPFANRDTLGIEHDDQGQPFTPRPDALYAASAALVASKCQQYDIPIDRAHIRKHSEVSASPTGCPDSLDIDRIVRQAAAQGDFMTQDQINTWVRSTFQQGRGSQPKDIAERDYWAAQVAANGLEATYVELMGHPDFVTYHARLLAALNAGGGVGPAGPQGPPGPMPDVSGFSAIGHDHQVSGTAK